MSLFFISHGWTFWTVHIHPSIHPSIYLSIRSICVCANTHRHTYICVYSPYLYIYVFVFYFYYFKDFIYLFFREREREGEREGEKHQCVVASSAPRTGDQARNPGTCPNWESNLWFTGLRSIHWATPARLCTYIYFFIFWEGNINFLFYLFIDWLVDSSTCSDQRLNPQPWRYPARAPAGMFYVSLILRPSWTL